MPPPRFRAGRSSSVRQSTCGASALSANQNRIQTDLRKEPRVADSKKGLSGKLALVTGGSRGIGAAIAKRLAADGAAVLVHYANSSDKANAVVADIKKAGGEAQAVGADLSKSDGPRSLI